MTIAPKVRRQAKALYLDNHSLDEIAEKLDINMNTLKTWIDKGTVNEPAWKTLKENLKPRLKEVLENPHIECGLEDAYAAGVNIVARSLAALDSSGETLTVAGIDRLISALDKIDRWQRAGGDAEAEPAEPVSLRKAQQEIMQHPFLEPTDG